MDTPSFRDLVAVGRTAAECWNEFDIAQMHCEQAFGTPFNAAKGILNTDINVAEARGVDLAPFQGPESSFKFPDLSAHIVVRVTRKPTGHKNIDKISAKIEKLELQLKAAKIERKSLIEQLVITGAVDQVTDNIGLAFTRLK